jgi:hypothetical protein
MAQLTAGRHNGSRGRMLCGLQASLDDGGECVVTGDT